MSRPRWEPAPGVEGFGVRTPTLPPATHTNAWVLEGRFVVDPASPRPDEQEALRAHLAEHPLEAVLLTHHHHDHVGGVAALVASRGLAVLAHPETAARVRFPVDGLLRDGDRLGDWLVLHTPGHAPGHLCFLREADGTLVAGDMVAGEGTVVLDPPEGDLARYLDSLARLERAGARLLLPAHGTPIPDGQARLRAYVAHRHERTEQVRRGLAAGPARPEDLVPAIYADVPAAFWPIAARQVLCHLLWLRSVGEVAETGGVFTLMRSPPEGAP